MDCAKLLIFSYICISQLTFVVFHNYLLWHFTTNFCGILQLTFVAFHNYLLWCFTTFAPKNCVFMPKTKGGSKGFTLEPPLIYSCVLLFRKDIGCATCVNVLSIA